MELTDGVHQHQGAAAILSYRKCENLREVFQSDQNHSYKCLSQGLVTILAFHEKPPTVIRYYKFPMNCVIFLLLEKYLINEKLTYTYWFTLMTFLRKVSNHIFFKTATYFLKKCFELHFYFATLSPEPVICIVLSLVELGFFKAGAQGSDSPCFKKG